MIRQSFGIIINIRKQQPGHLKKPKKYCLYYETIINPRHRVNDVPT